MKRRLIDGNSTGEDWAGVKSGICVLPVGACEQHARHLPIASDNLQANLFGEWIAREFNAALLPTIPFANSFEHSAFPGTFSLRPETLMAVIRDLAEEAERQNFHTLILVNTHGGNFALGPVVRDINRRNRRLKIIFCNPWEGADQLLKNRTAADIHAGEVETSFMLSFFPQKVGKARKDIKDKRWETGEFSRSDLNLFGVHRVSPEGVLGYSSKAKLETGRKIATIMKENTLKMIKEKMKLLNKSRKY